MSSTEIIDGTARLPGELRQEYLDRIHREEREREDFAARQARTQEEKLIHAAVAMAELHGLTVVRSALVGCTVVLRDLAGKYWMLIGGATKRSPDEPLSFKRLETVTIETAEFLARLGFFSDTGAGEMMMLGTGLEDDSFWARLSRKFGG